MSKKPLESYLALLEENSPELNFLNQTPWFYDSQLQSPDILANTLKRDAAIVSEFAPKPFFSIITPMWNTPLRYIEGVILSMRCQSYQNWELLLVDDASLSLAHIARVKEWAHIDSRIKFFKHDENTGISSARNTALKHASGDYMALLDHDDLIHPLALSTFAKIIVASPSKIDFIYSNEAKIDEKGQHLSDFLAKPEPDLFTLLRVNYICHFSAFHKEILPRIKTEEALYFRPEFDGCEDHDVFLRIFSLKDIKITHAPYFLYYWRKSPQSTALSLDKKPLAVKRAEKMIFLHCQKIYGDNNFTLRSPGDGSKSGYFSIHLHNKQRIAVKLLVVIPYKDQVLLTLKCLDSLEKQVHDLDTTVVLVNNNSTEKDTNENLKSWLAKPRRNTYVTVDYPHAFNFAKINNFAVREKGSDSDFLLFLNNDVEFKSTNVLTTLANQLDSDKQSGVLGIKLNYPDSMSVQHGGIACTPDLVFTGLNAIGHFHHPHQFVNDEHIVLGNTFACAMMTKALFDKLNGLDEIKAPNGFGDVDFCLRALNAGYANYYFGTLEGIHHESPSRGKTSEEFEFNELYERHSATIMRWRLRSLSYNLHNTLAGKLHGMSQSAQNQQIPMRYKLADRINSILKKYLSPLHSFLKKFMNQLRFMLSKAV